MAPVRNPLAGFALTILVALGLSLLAMAGTLPIPYLEFLLFYLGFALFGVGLVAGRLACLGSLGFVGSYLGAFVGLYLGEVLFWPNPWMVLVALAFSAPCALGGGLGGHLGTRRLERALSSAPALRRCRSCGARVGESARRCWSCKASLGM